MIFKYALLLLADSKNASPHGYYHVAPAALLITWPCGAINIPSLWRCWDAIFKFT